MRKNTLSLFRERAGHLLRIAYNGANRSTAIKFAYFHFSFGCDYLQRSAFISTGPGTKMRSICVTFLRKQKDEIIYPSSVALYGCSFSSCMLTTAT